jgi:F-type H+-transporting ATPase subunit gamma
MTGKGNKKQISSVSSTMHKSWYLKMVSAAKLEKAQDANTAMRPCSDKLTEILQNLR